MLLFAAQCRQIDSGESDTIQQNGKQHIQQQSKGLCRILELLAY